MTVDQILRCKLFYAATNIAYANLYGMNCDSSAYDNLIKYYNYLKLYNSNCTKTFDLLCLIEESTVKYVDQSCTNKYTQGTPCLLELTDITPTPTVTCSPLILIEK